MNHMNHINHLSVQSHIDQLNREAEAQRLVNEANTATQASPFLATIGQQMIRLGEKLQAMSISTTHEVVQPSNTQLANAQPAQRISS